MFQQTAGRLDANGHAQAAIHLPPLGIPSLVGLVLYHAFVTYDAQAFRTASNPVRLTLNP